MDIALAILRAVFFVVIAYAVVFVAALVNIVFERRVLAFMQDRHGPNRTGPHGVLQSIADAFKMMGKEDFRPTLADPVLFTLAPIMVMMGAVAVQLVIPYTDGLMATGLDVGLIFIVAITGFTTMAILLGGWSSRNKYSLVGALRAAAQMISYEIPMILGLLVVAMIVGSLRIADVVAAQGGYQWIAFYAPFTFLIFYIASIAELNRGPFDLPESESELVSGYGTEYSGMRFGMFFLNEYAGMTIMSMVTVTLFFGGWQGPFADAVVFWGVSWIGLLVPRQDLHPRLRAGLDPPVAAAPPGRPAHGVRLEDPHPAGPAQHPRDRGRHAVGAAVEVGHGRVQLARAVGVRGPVRPHPQVAPAPAARPPPGGERLMLGMFKAMRTTLKHLPMKKITVQYPEQRERLPERSRGLFRVVIDPTSGEPRCRSCTLCESNCPVQVIRVNYTSKYQLPVPNAARIAAARLAAQPGVDLAPLQPVLADYYEHGTGLIAMLQNAQEAYGYLPRLALQEVSLQTGVSLSQIYGVVQLLQPVPPLAGGRVHHRRVPRHGLPRGGGRADHRSPGGRARHPRRQDHHGHEVHAVLGGLHGGVLSGSGDAHRRADLRRPHP